MTDEQLRQNVDLVQAPTERSTSNDSSRTIINVSDDNDSDNCSGFSSDEEGYENTSEIELVEQRKKQEKVRRHIVEELLSTERLYFDRLGFFKQIKEQLESLNSIKCIMPPEEVDKMFPLIDSLYNFHNETLLPAFMLVVRNWKDFHSSIGHVFLIHESKLEIYRQYIKAFPRSVMTLESWRKRQPDFNELLKLFQQNSSTKLLDIFWIMREPAVKLQRWNQLLCRYEQHLPPSNADCEDIPKIISKLEAVLRNCEDALKREDNLDMLVRLVKKVEGLSVLLSSDTEFIKDGPVVEVDPRCLRVCLNPIKRNEKQRHLFLFNDMILICTAKRKYKKFRIRSMILLQTIKLVPADSLATMGYQSNRCFILQTTKKAFPLLFTTSEVKEQWWKTVMGLWTARPQNMAESSCSDFTCAPIWVPDIAAKSCMFCSIHEFNLVTCRRHHCRGCGILICSSCSPGKLRLPYDDSTSAIVCFACYNQARRVFPHLRVDPDSKTQWYLRCSQDQQWQDQDQGQDHSSQDQDQDLSSHDQDQDQERHWQDQDQNHC